MSSPAEILARIYSYGNIGAVMEIDFHSAGSNDRTPEREVHFRLDRSDLRTGKRKEKKRKLKSLVDNISKRRSLLLNNMMSEERFV